PERAGSTGSGAELAHDLARVEGLPATIARPLGELSIQLHQQEDQVAAYRLALQQCRQLGEVDQPVRVPRGPVSVVTVDDAVDAVMRLSRLGQELLDPIGDAIHASIGTIP